jgi:hypothetical protein
MSDLSSYEQDQIVVEAAERCAAALRTHTPRPVTQQDAEKLGTELFKTLWGDRWIHIARLALARTGYEATPKLEEKMAVEMGTEAARRAFAGDNAIVVNPPFEAPSV